MTEPHDGSRAPGPPGVLDALRDGWHSLGGGSPEACPGCPVCRLADTTGRVDPATAAHLQAAAGHVLQAGRELLAALEGATRRPAPPDRPQDQPDDQPDDQAPDRPEDRTAARRTIPVSRPGPDPTTPAEEPHP